MKFALIIHRNLRLNEGLHVAKLDNRSIRYMAYCCIVHYSWQFSQPISCWNGCCCFGILDSSEKLTGNREE
jgi:hypothetical protein